MDYELTDPASEMANVINFLREQPASNNATWSVIQNAIGQKISTKDYWHLLSALRFRLEKLERLITSADDAEFRHKEQRNRLLQAIGRFSAAFEPAQQAVQWQTTWSQSINADDGLQLATFSYVARRLWPLRRLSEEDRLDLIQRIDQVLAAIDKSDDIPSWAKAPLADGLIRMQLTLRHLLFFGYEAAIEELQTLYQRTLSVEDIIGAEQQGEQTRAKTILRILEIIALVGALFSLPDQTMTAFERYQGLYLRAVTNSPRLPKPEQLLLAAPAAVEPQPPSEEQKS